VLTVLFCNSVNTEQYKTEIIMSQTLSVRLPDNLAAELNNIAEITERSKSYLVQKALEIYLQEQADLQVAIDRLRDVSDPLVSMVEMRREIGL